MLSAMLFAPPAQVAGPWEALVAPGVVAGFSLQITTNADETVRWVRVDTYVRRGRKTTSTWWISDEPGSFTMQGRELRFRQSRSTSSGFDVNLALTYDARNTEWKGSFSNGLFLGHVALRRPNMSAASAPAGTWRTYSDVTNWPMQRVDGYGCLNIGVGQDSALVLWSEDHNIFLGFDKAKRPFFGDSYGELYDDSDASHYANEWSFLAGNSMSGDRITGTMSANGSTFGGYYSDHYGNGLIDPSHPLRRLAWTRMPDFACRP